MYHRAWNFQLCFKRAPKSFSPIFDSKFKGLGLLSPGFRIEGIAKTNVCSEKSFFYRFRIVFLLLFESLGSSFSGFAALETALRIDDC